MLTMTAWEIEEFDMYESAFRRIVELSQALLDGSDEGDSGYGELCRINELSKMMLKVIDFKKSITTTTTGQLPISTDPISHIGD